MWLFLFTEILLFGTLFIVYAVYLRTYGWQFGAAGARSSSIPVGAANTVVLLTSSLTVALSIAALRAGRTGPGAPPARRHPPPAPRRSW